jgi:zinc-dependent metalloproteinase lipoprotein
MRKILYFMIALTVLSFASCKDTEGSIGDPIISHGQDRDTDIITGDDYVYHLPVIFHVFYSNTTQYIEYTRLKEILSNVNELYQGDVYNYQMEYHRAKRAENDRRLREVLVGMKKKKRKSAVN